MEHTDLVTRATVVLERPSQWEAWLFLRRSTAEQYGIWEYCNPDIEQSKLTELIKPSAPKTTSYNNTTSFANLSADERAAFQFEYKLYECDLAEYTVKKKALGLLSAEIAKTVSKDSLFHIYDCFQAGERLRKLKRVFAPSDATRSRELLAKYKDLQQTQRGKQVEA